MSPKTKQSVLELAWRPLLSQADKSRVRKGKQDARNHVVTEVQAHEGYISGLVRNTGPERGTLRVVVPWLADYRSHRLSVAKWLAERSDWVAAHFAGEWDPSFKAFLSTNQIQVFPDETAVEHLGWDVKCTCSDWQPLCGHVLALLFHLLWDADDHPLHVFRFVGLDVDWLLDEAHRQGAENREVNEIDKDILQFESDEEQNVAKFSDMNDYLQALEQVEPNGRLVPQFIVT